MATSSELKRLTRERISEAEVLLENDRFEGVFYLAGYAIEFSLKVVVCHRPGIEMYDQQNIQGDKDVSQKVVSAFMTHNLEDLLVLAGLKVPLDADILMRGDLARAWSETCKWSEQRRYVCGCTKEHAEKFPGNSKLILTWIKNQW